MTKIEKAVTWALAIANETLMDTISSTDGDLIMTVPP